MCISCFLCNLVYFKIFLLFIAFNFDDGCLWYTGRQLEIWMQTSTRSMTRDLIVYQTNFFKRLYGTYRSKRQFKLVLCPSDGGVYERAFQQLSWNFQRSILGYIIYEGEFSRKWGIISWRSSSGRPSNPSSCFRCLFASMSLIASMYTIHYQN